MKKPTYTEYLIFDDPIPYKNLRIYPATMREYLFFHLFSECLLVEKNSIPDAEIISMTYLEFLLRKSTKDKPYVVMLDRLLKICLRQPQLEIKYGIDKKKAFFSIGDETYDSEDFDKIRDIICEQNLLELPDETIQKEIRDKIKEAEEFRRKQSNYKMASLEDQIICVLISTGLTIEDISKLSIRKFVKILQRVDHKLHYEIYLSASMSGLVEFKKKDFIKHWMADLSQDKLAENTMGLDTVKDKMSLEDKKASGATRKYNTQKGSRRK